MRTLKLSVSPGSARRLRVPLAALAAATLLGLSIPAAAHAQTAVSVFPIPGDKVATRNTQIVIRGVPTSQFGTITVTGSRSGAHTGKIEGDSDGLGGSFIPSKPFEAGETVTVTTALDVIGATNGTWTFTVETPGHPAGLRNLPSKAKVEHDIWTFRTTSIKPASLNVTHAAKGIAPGDLFLAPQLGPIANGVELLNSVGRLVWYKPVPNGDYATDFTPATYAGKSVLTWWQGRVTTSGTGRGLEEIYSDDYRHVATIHAGNGLLGDLHEFALEPNGTAWITAYQPVIWNSTSVKGGSRKELVYDSVAQEIDVKTGLVLFQWDSLDHVPVTTSYSPVARQKNVPWDYFHINSIQPLPDGSVLISSRNTCAVYDVSGQTGAVNWIVGGKVSTFALGKGARFYFQHDARILPNGQLTLFDDAGQPYYEKQSRGLTLNLNFTARTATVATQFVHDPLLKAPAEGSDQLLSNGDTLLGWGQAPDAATEFNSAGKAVFDMKFTGPNASYRVFRAPWTGYGRGRPAVATHAYKGQTSVSASWSGTTVTHMWRVLGGSSAKSLKVVGTYLKSRFETTVETHRQLAYVEVQAIDDAGKLISSSRVAKAAS